MLLIHVHACTYAFTHALLYTHSIIRTLHYLVYIHTHSLLFLLLSVVPFVKIGSGYNSHEWSTLNQHLEPLLIKPTSSTPSISELKGSDRPDLIVRDPLQSVVIQVKGSQIVASGMYKTLGLSLRFPRFIKLRLDRKADSSLKVVELMKLKEITAGTLVNRSAADSLTKEKKKRQVNRAKGKMITVNLNL